MQQSDLGLLVDLLIYFDFVVVIVVAVVVVGHWFVHCLLAARF